MPVSNYPFDNRVPRRLIIAGRYGHPSRQINAGERPGEPTEVPVLRTPAIQSDSERGEGDSTNSRMHRIIGGAK